MFVDCLVIVWCNTGVLVIKLHAPSFRPLHKKFCRLHFSIGGCDSVTSMTGEPRERRGVKAQLLALVALYGIQKMDYQALSLARLTILDLEGCKPI